MDMRMEIGIRKCVLRDSMKIFQSPAFHEINGGLYIALVI